MGRNAGGFSGSFKVIVPLPERKRPRCREPVPAGRVPHGSALAPPRHPASRTPIPGCPSPPPAAHGRQGRGVGPLTFLPLLLLAAEAAAPSPRLPESPAAAAVSNQPADSGSDLVQELSQDTHCLPGPPPRSRCRR